MSPYIHVRSTFTLYPEPITGYRLNESGSNRARHSPQKETPLTPPTLEEDDDKGQVQVNDTDTIRGNIGDVAEKGPALPTPHL